MLSIIIPVYKGENSLNRCLCSLAAQTSRDFEAIFVDDGSPDGTSARIERFIEDHKDVPARLITLPKNVGEGAARDAGIAAATGEYLAFIDHDDAVAPEYAETLLEVAARTDADMIGFDLYLERNGHRHRDYSFNARTRSGWVEKEKAMYRSGGSICQWIFRRAIIVENGVTGSKSPRGADLCFTVICMALSDRIYYKNTPLYFYIYHPGSASVSAKTRDPENHVKGYAHIEESLRSKRPETLSPLYLRFAVYSPLMNMLSNGAPTHEIRAFVKRQIDNRPEAFACPELRHFPFRMQLALKLVRKDRIALFRFLFSFARGARARMRRALRAVRRVLPL